MRTLVAALLTLGAPALAAAQELAVTAPTVTVTGATNRATVAWSYVRGALGYQVMRREVAQDAKTLPAPTAWAQVAAAPGSPFGDVLPKPSVTYEYRVDAVLRGGALVSSAPVPYAAPPFTTATNVVAAGTGMNVSLTWTAATNVTGYHVVRRMTGTGGVILETVQRTTTPLTVTTFADVVPQPGLRYDYEVVSIDPAGLRYSSAWAGYVAPMVLVAPSVTILGNTDKAELTWGATAGAYGYRVERVELDPRGQPLTKPIEVARLTQALTVADPLPNPGSTYRYMVQAVTAEGVLGPTTELDFVAPPFTTPAGVLVSGAGGRVRISWFFGGGIAFSTVYRRTVAPDGSTTVPSKMIASRLATTSFVDALPAPGVIYEYQVSGVGMDGREWPSAWVRYVAGKW